VGLVLPSSFVLPLTSVLYIFVKNFLVFEDLQAEPAASCMESRVPL
jgi:hypothetical protein